MADTKPRPKSASFSTAALQADRPSLGSRSITSTNVSTGSPGRVRLRRTISGLQGEPRGDATGPSFATAHFNRPATEEEKQKAAQTEQREQQQDKHRPRRSRRRRVKSLFRRWKDVSLRHTWLNPLIVLLSVVALYLLNPNPTNPVHSALFLSYPRTRTMAESLAGTPIQYGKGPRDFAFVAFYTIFFSFTREFVMQRFLRPFAIWCGIRSRGKQARFMEQGYTALYFGVFGPFGLYVMSRNPIWYFDTEAMYRGFPHTEHEPLFKAYYLLQASYWAQQAIVLLLLLEKPRKDFKELVAHHIITLTLIGLSYRFHFMYMGIAIYITHDISDFFLATSKVLNYLDSPIVIPYFIIFLGSWTYLRHYINLHIISSMLPMPSPFPDSVSAQIHNAIETVSTPILSTLTSITPLPIAQTVSRYAPYFKIIDFTTRTANPYTTSQFSTIGPYILDWGAQQYKCWISQWATFVLLGSLQAVNLFWLFLILRILWRLAVSFGQVHEDDRSEVDEEDEEEMKEAIQDAKAAVGGGGDAPAAAAAPEILLNGESLDEEKR